MSTMIVQRYGGGESENGMTGMHVVELGAGTGLPGLVCASLGASVLLTDNNPGVLRLLEMNVDANLKGGASVAALEWGPDAAARLNSTLPEAPHLIVASECAYCESAIAPLAVTILDLAAPAADPDGPDTPPGSGGATQVAVFFILLSTGCWHSSATLTLLYIYVHARTRAARARAHTHTHRVLEFLRCV